MAYCQLTKNSFDYQWRSISNISPYLQQAVITSEDQTFLNHYGFDFTQMHKAIEDYTLSGKQRGASTITMQTARSLFLWQGHSWFRKALEAYFTVLLELLWDKQRILEVYLNVIEWGNGIYGVESAAQNYFKCTSLSLTKSQAALLAAVLPNPLRWSPVKPTNYIVRRKNSILNSMDNFKSLHF